MTTTAIAGSKPRSGQLLLVAAWFGLAAGLLEGLAKWGLPVLGWAGSTRFCLNGLKALWAAVSVDLVLFTAIALLLVPLARLTPRLPWVVLATGLFATLLFYGLLFVTGRLRERGAVVLALGLGVVAARWMKKNPSQRLALLRRTLVPLALVVLILAGGPWPAMALHERLARARAPQPPTGAPSVLLIVMDTVRFDRLGAYGYAKPTTPFLDEFARQSVLFERAIANSSWSLPSHVTLMTGRLPGEHGGATLGQSFDGRFPTLARVLAARGYATAGFVANSGYASCARGLGDGFQHYEDTFAPASQIMDCMLATRLYSRVLSKLYPIEQPREWYSAHDINRSFLSWVDAHGDRPFFAFLNFMETHYPYQPPAELAARFSDDPHPVRPAQWYPMHNGERPLDPALVQRASGHYDASLAALDAQLRAMFAELDRRGLSNNLLVIITADHGEAFGEHGLLEHQISLYSDQIRVPLLVRMPGSTPAGMRVPAPVGLNQVAATVAKLTGMTENPFHGTPLDVFWTGNAPADTAVVSEVVGGAWPGVPKHWPIYHGTIRSLVTERWHLLLTGNDSIELFDWSTDPHEDHNLATDPNYQSVLAELQQRLHDLSAAPQTPVAKRTGAQ